MFHCVRVRAFDTHSKVKNRTLYKQYIGEYGEMLTNALYKCVSSDKKELVINQLKIICMCSKV